MNEDERLWRPESLVRQPIADGHPRLGYDAVTEAGAQGTPTVAYRYAGGVAESVHDGKTGLLVDDLDQLVAATRDLLGSPGERCRLGRAARELATSLTWTATTDVVEGLLLEQRALGETGQLP